MKKVLLAGAILVSATAANANNSSVTLHATLDGASVTNGGDSNGQGQFTAEVNESQGTICYVLTASNIGTPGVAHIHEGVSGLPGRPVVDLAVGADQCLSVGSAVANDIVDNPSDYYVDVLSAQHPEGAVRGQISK